ncbi:cytochrome c3 family protein [Desulfurivibrio sp. D14AmB]|uniref:cytochrome c3 family protein n=1 Tax=Desulfurivibrio sp. D14AmB TaxID=3374370 RepID=UPI00376ED3AC
MAGKSVELGKINWLVESAVPHTEHGFLLPAKQVGESLEVEFHGPGGNFPPQTISVPPLAGLAEVADRGRPPVISDVQLLEVRRGIFLSATIGWRTDTLADARVRYGAGDLTQLSPPSSRLSQNHRVVLYDLQPGTSYRFAVESRDLFGRTQLSETLSFSTKKPLAISRPPTVGRPDSPVAKPAFASRFQRLGEYYLVQLSLPDPATVSLGVREFARGALPAVLGGGEDGPVVNHHAGLNGKLATSMEVCLGCHSKQLGASHPVNVLPPPGMTVPLEYPTLPDGRITCMSCHQFHGSDNPYRLIKAVQRELCVGCHRNMR